MTESQNHLPEEDINIIEEMARIVTVIEESKQNITSTQFNLIKSLFTIIPELKSIPTKIQSAVTNFMHVRAYKPEDLIISPDDKHPEAFIIAEGSCYYSQTKDHIHPKKIISYLKKNKDDPNKYCATKCLGDFYAITNQRWKLGTVIAVEPMKVICLSMAAIDKKLKDLETNTQSQEIIQFLCQYLPGFQKLNRYRDRLAGSFRVREYAANSEIFKEEMTCASAFLIKEGEVRLLKEKSTVETVAAENGQGKYVDTTLQCKRGFLSDSFSKFQLGEAVTGQWIGDDFVVFDNTTYSYTAVAKTKVVCLELQKDDYDTIPIELLNHFRKHVLDRRAWILDRMKNVAQFVDKLMKISNTIDYSDSLEAKKRKHPLATMSVIDAIRKKELSKGLLNMQSELNLPEIPLKEIRKHSMSNGEIKPSLKFRSLFRLGHPLSINDSIEKESNESPSGISKYLTKCTPLSYASATKPLNSMFPIIQKDTKPESKLTQSVSFSSPLSPLNNVKVSSKFGKKELNTFSIGKKTISLLSSRKAKPPTPNPYFIK